MYSESSSRKAWAHLELPEENTLQKATREKQSMAVNW